MTFLFGLTIVVLIAVIIVQIGKLSQLSDKIRGEEEVQLMTNNTSSKLMVAFMVLFLVGTAYSGYYYKDFFLGFPGNPVNTRPAIAAISLNCRRVICEAFIVGLSASWTSSGAKSS